ncbi:hypothetical protein ETB97_008737 [Aspergillus alliaceus]|uniref:Uncharacterized protein n=1 Tax=Petromyces alliaceus TaxID=209559 RepID=A0A8H6AGH3_PETAA|nr:hypothetical protein ETB97_008737 [Aspergillus burnettii]
MGGLASCRIGLSADPRTTVQAEVKGRLKNAHGDKTRLYSRQANVGFSLAFGVLKWQSTTRSESNACENVAFRQPIRNHWLNQAMIRLLSDDSLDNFWAVKAFDFTVPFRAPMREAKCATDFASQ